MNDEIAVLIANDVLSQPERHNTISLSRGEEIMVIGYANKRQQEACSDHSQLVAEGMSDHDEMWCFVFNNSEKQFVEVMFSDWQFDWLLENGNHE